MSRQQTQQRILSAAARLFAERGYVGTTTSAIAADAGVNEVTLFRHFESKQGVLRALGARLDSGAGEYPPREALVRDDPVATLRNLAAIEISGAIASGGLVLRLSFDARSVPEVRSALGDVSGSNLAQLTAWLQACQDRGQLRTDVAADLMAEAFFGLTSTLVMSRMAVGTPVPAPGRVAAIAARQVELLWSGIGPQPDQR
ncbi:MAG: TetR/AcrR family transcriptional regulator [Chloroflexota bacterium]|jgi:AcrR family transcriptional regulator